MVMSYWTAQQGKSPDSADDVAVIQRELYSRSEHGISTDKMREYLLQHKFQVFALSGSWRDLEDHLRRGRPLIVALKPSGQSEFHYVVVDGIDTSRDTVTINDPAERKLMTRERAEFEKEWSATKNWTLLAVPRVN